MQGLGIRRAKSVDHREWPDLDADGVNDKRVAFKMADRIAVPRRCDTSGMSLVQAYAPKLVIKGIENQNLIALLHDLRFQNAEDIWRTFGQALIVRVGKAYATARNLAEPFHDL